MWTGSLFSQNAVVNAWHSYDGQRNIQWENPNLCCTYITVLPVTTVSRSDNSLLWDERPSAHQRSIAPTSDQDQVRKFTWKSAANILWKILWRNFQKYFEKYSTRFSICSPIDSAPWQRRKKIFHSLRSNHNKSEKKTLASDHPGMCPTLSNLAMSLLWLSADKKMTVALCFIQWKGVKP